MKPVPTMLTAVWSMTMYLQLIFLFHASFLWSQPSRVALASALGNETDYLALLEFKESISNDPFEILGSWNSSTHFCSWHGITCGHRHQRVVELNLQSYGLLGFISPHVGNLSFLRILHLQENRLKGEIPQELGRLFRLQRLSLNNNTLSGEIPINLTNCSELRYLNLSLNGFVGKIPTEIDSLWNLESFSISRNNFVGKIPYSIGNLSTLTHLWVAVNNLEGNIPDEIGHLRNLTVIKIGRNNFFGTLPSSLYNISSLMLISATLNQFNGSLPDNMFLTLPNLQNFGINDNHMTGLIPNSIMNASVLQIFCIGGNHFAGQVPSLGNLQDLRWLDLDQNDLGNGSEKGLDFITSLANCSKLEIISLSKNKFGGKLPNSIANLSTQLVQLYLGDDLMYGTIPDGLGNYVNLIALVMELNHFSGNIPNTFGKLQKMQLLALGENKLSGEIPTSLSNLSQLNELYLSKNMLEGSIPPSVGNWKILNLLDLSQNNLSGAIPMQVFSLFSLSKFLDLSHNSFNGSLPFEVGILKSLSNLDISANQLSGEIPSTIGECLNLEYLNLQQNSLNGTIPSLLGSLKGLQYLDLSRNNLSGSIPESLQKLSLLNHLNVSFNMLDGKVPTEGVFQNASVLSLSGNSRLCGGITELQLPPCPVKVTKKHHNFKLIIAITCVVVFLLLVSSILVIYLLQKRKKSSSASPIDQASNVSYQSLQHATEGFSANNQIGSGSFGSVYKATLEPEYGVVAIKVLNLQKKGARSSFIAECNALRKIRHRNLVKILTCCSSTDYKGQEFKALVFEYMANGSLEKWLHSGIESANQPRTLSLVQRINIINDVSYALHYLHHECEQPVIHCDLKPENLLLDHDMVAHVGDFGLARLLSTINNFSHKQTSSILIKGTIGYAPPEYGMGFDVSTQGDVYSFGILVLEMLTGRRPTEDMFRDGKNLHSYVKTAFPNNLLQIVDSAIFHEESQMRASLEEERDRENLILMPPNVEKCLVSLFKIGLDCSAESPKERMDMVNVIRELNHIKNAFPSGSGGINRN